MPLGISTLILFVFIPFYYAHFLALCNSFKPFNILTIQTPKRSSHWGHYWTLFRFLIPFKLFKIFNFFSILFNMGVNGRIWNSVETVMIFEIYVVLQFLSKKKHLNTILFRTFSFLWLVLFYLISSKHFKLLSSKVEQLFKFSTILTLQPMGGGRSPPPTSALIFSSVFHQFKPFKHWAVQDIQLFMVHIWF